MPILREKTFRLLEGRDSRLLSIFSSDLCQNGNSNERMLSSCRVPIYLITAPILAMVRIFTTTVSHYLPEIVEAEENQGSIQRSVTKGPNRPAGGNPGIMAASPFLSIFRITLLV